MRQFEESCKKVVDETTNRFLDLAQDEGPQSMYGENMNTK